MSADHSPTPTQHSKSLQWVDVCPALPLSNSTALCLLLHLLLLLLPLYLLLLPLLVLLLLLITPSIVLLLVILLLPLLLLPEQSIKGLVAAAVLESKAQPRASYV